MRLSAVGFIVTLALASLVAALGAEAQPTSKVPLLGFLTSGFPSSQDAPFRTQLHELGWHEGRNIAIADRYAEDHGERLPTLAAARF